MQGLALQGQAAFGLVAGPAAGAEAFLQVLLAPFQLAALLLVGLLLLFPLVAFGHQGLHRHHQPLFIAGQGIELALEPFGAEAAFPLGREQAIAA